MNALDSYTEVSLPDGTREVTVRVSPTHPIDLEPFLHLPIADDVERFVLLCREKRPARMVEDDGQRRLIWDGVLVANGGFGSLRVIAGPHSFRFFSDDSLVYRRYVGPPGGAYRRLFYRNQFVNAKLYGQPRLTLRYEPSERRNSVQRSIEPLADSRRSDNLFRYTVRLPPYLLNNDDLGREYAAEGDEPRLLHTRRVLSEVSTILKDRVARLNRMSALGSSRRRRG